MRASEPPSVARNSRMLESMPLAAARPGLRRAQFGGRRRVMLRLAFRSNVEEQTDLGGLRFV